MTFEEYKENAEEDESEKINLFGRDLRKIPCFRNSMLNGIFGGLAVGFGHFMFTSKVKRSYDIGFASFCVITISYWVHCRYKWTKDKFEAQKLKRFVHEINTQEGTDDEIKPDDVC